MTGVKILRTKISLLLLLLTVGAANAEPIKLSVSDAIGLAARQNSLVKVAGYRAIAARHGVTGATSRYYPGLFFEETFAASNAPTQTFMMKLDQGQFTQNDFLISNLNNPGSYHDFKTALTLYQPLFDPLIAPAKEMAVKEAEIQEHGSDAIKQDAGFNAFRLYLELQKAKAQSLAAEQSVIEARESLRLATVMVTAGTGLKSDELRARTHLAIADQKLLGAQNRVIMAGIQLVNFLGLKAGDTVDVEAAVTTVNISHSFDELIRLALENRNELKQSRSELARNEAALQLARRAYLPSAGAFASYQLNAKDTPFGSSNDSWRAGVTLTWQLFDGFRRGSEQERTIANRSAAEEMIDNTQRNISMAVKESTLRHDVTGKQLEVARFAVADAEETVRLLSRRFENSLATMSELLDAQTVLNQSRANLIDSEADYAYAGGQVLHTAGIFLKEMLK